jgi:hypothetical protein
MSMLSLFVIIGWLGSFPAVNMLPIINISIAMNYPTSVSVPSAVERSQTELKSDMNELEPSRLD